MKRRRLLNEEDRRLWLAVARTTAPMPGRALPPEEPASSPAMAQAQHLSTTTSRLVSDAGAPAPAEARERLSKAPQDRLDRPVRRKLGKGRIEIEDRIDLHGKTEAVAHYALLNFLRSARQAGLRHVLVITGRGASLGSTGVLRRAFPHWIATEAFRGLVSGFDVAERTHGGEGAFYVRLRKG